MLYKKITSFEYFDMVFGHPIPGSGVVVATSYKKFIKDNWIDISNIELLELGKIGNIQFDSQARVVLCSDVGEYNITKVVDDWFYVMYNDPTPNKMYNSSDYLFYKCDQFDGLKSLIYAI